MLSKLKLWLVIALGGGLAIVSIMLKSVRADKTRLAKQVEVLEINAKIKQETHIADILISKVDVLVKERKKNHKETEENLDKLEEEIQLKAKVNVARQADENFTSINR